MSVQFRVVMDTNILLRGLINMQSAAGRVVQACDSRAVLLLLSKPVISEYWGVLTDASVVKGFPELTADKVNIALRRLRYVSDVLRSVHTRFEYSRDPKDAKFIELAIAGKATHIVSGDKDLLSLAFGHGDAAVRFRQRAPATRVLEAGAFLDTLESAL